MQAFTLVGFRIIVDVVWGWTFVFELPAILSSIPGKNGTLTFFAALQYFSTSGSLFSFHHFRNFGYGTKLLSVSSISNSLLAGWLYSKRSGLGVDPDPVPKFFGIRDSGPKLPIQT